MLSDNLFKVEVQCFTALHLNDGKQIQLYS